MQKIPENLYEFAIIRYLPRVEREEFVNIGLIMMCKRRKWIRVAMNIDTDKITMLGSLIPLEQLQRQIDSFTAITNGAKEGGEMALLPVEERFRWLTAVRSACLQTSRPHPGLCDDLDATFDKIYSEMVL